MSRSNKTRSELSATAPVFVPRAQQRREEKNTSAITSLNPSWIVRSNGTYQISNRRIREALKDPSRGSQKYIWLDATVMRLLTLDNLSDSSSYVLDQRDFYEEKKTQFCREFSSIHHLGVLSGYIIEDGSVAFIHEVGMFSIPCYFHGITDGFLQIGRVVPKSKLLEKHQAPGNQLKAHNRQDLLLISSILANEFKSLVVATKLAAHELYMTQRGVVRYSRPKWCITTKEKVHRATLHYEAPFRDIITAMKFVLTDSNGKYDKNRYSRIIEDCTRKVELDHFDGNEVARWRNDQNYPLHAHKFPLDIEKLEKYETLAYLRHQRSMGVNIVDDRTYNYLKSDPSLFSILVLENGPSPKRGLEQGSRG